MATCEGCEAHVTERYAAVFGDDDDRVFRCPSCSQLVDVRDGGAAIEVPIDE